MARRSGLRAVAGAPGAGPVEEAFGGDEVVVGANLDRGAVDIHGGSRANQVRVATLEAFRLEVDSPQVPCAPAGALAFPGVGFGPTGASAGVPSSGWVQKRARSTLASLADRLADAESSRSIAEPHAR